MEMMKVVQVYDKLSSIGGAEKVIADLFHNLPKFINCKSYAMSFTNYSNIAEVLNIQESKYLKLNINNLIKLESDIVLLSHHRKVTTILIFFKRIFFKRWRIIHVAHSEFSDLKYFSLFPKKVIAVSESVKKNHIEYFNIPKRNITVINNGIKDNANTVEYLELGNRINLIYLARICEGKQQIELVKQLKGKLQSNIHIYFAGIGKDYEKLLSLTENEDQFHAVGFVSDVKQIYKNMHFTLLYSLQEGLPISLIEACMYSKPIVCNDVGGNREVLDGNGRLVNNYSELIEALNSLSSYSFEEYKRMCEKSRAIYLEKFKFNYMIQKYSDFINEASNYIFKMK